MFIEDPEGFKTWLTAKLEPLCEADPAALAKYVYALVKKDKPIEELKLSMVEQLEVFLQKETKGFVELLFKTLESGDFEVKTTAQAETAITAAPVKPPLEDVDLRVITTPVVPPLPPPPIPPPAPPKNFTTEPLPAKKEPVKETANTTTTTVPTVSVTTSTSTQDNQTFGSLVHSRKENNVERHPKKIESDDRVRPPRSRARRGMSMSPPMERSRRSRSYERRRSRSRDRDRSRAWRNKSPPLRPRYMDRRRSYSKSPIRRHSRSRSPPIKRGRYRNRSPPLRSHTRSLSPSRNSIERAILGSPVRRDTDLRLASSVQSMSSVLGINSDKPFGTKRCRDFDEKGFCMRGDLCPFDHGSDPVVLEDLPGSMYNGAAQVGPRAATNPLQIHHSHESPNSLEYNPSAPSLEPRIWRRFYRPGAIRGRGGLISGGGSAHAVQGAMEGAPFPKRELISVITGSPLPAREPSTPPYRASLPPSREMMGKRYEPYSRMGMSRRNASNSVQGATGSLPPATHPTNNTLQLKKVPLQFNNITHLNEHFSKFGKIVNILVGYEGDAESALITFSSYMEANNAYKSTEPILNNRFIKVFWYTPQPSTTNNGVEDDLVKKKIDEEALKEAKKKLEAKKEKIKMNAELRKRKQVLLEKQLNQQKLLIERMEGGNIKNEQKTTIMSTIKSLQESIEKLKKDLAQDVEASLSNIQTNKKPAPPPNPAQLFRKTKEETQRELLDAELDLLKQEQQGKDIVELKKKISDLKLKAFQLKIPIFKNTTPAFPAARGRGATFRTRRGAGATVRGRGSGRFTYNSLDYNVVDHRPTKLLVSGYEQDDKAEVLAHFNQFGEMVNYTSDDATPSLVLNYKTRKEAEAALAKGRNFQDRLLSVTWATPNHNIRPGVTTQNTQLMPEEDLGEDVLISGEEEDEIVGLMSPSESLILQDEEEDEEEDRTWRR